MTFSKCHFEYQYNIYCYRWQAVNANKRNRFYMYKNKLQSGQNNICGKNIKRLRQQLSEKTSQRKLAEMLQIKGLDLDKNAIQRIECGKRFVTDIELKAFAKVFDTSCDELLNGGCEDRI